jgi:hypothetical protein
MIFHGLSQAPQLGTRNLPGGLPKGGSSPVRAGRSVGHGIKSKEELILGYRGVQGSGLVWSKRGKEWKQDLLRRRICRLCRQKVGVEVDRSM